MDYLIILFEGQTHQFRTNVIDELYDDYNLCYTFFSLIRDELNTSYSRVISMLKYAA